MDQKAADLDLSFKFSFNDTHHNRCGIDLSGGITRLITEGGFKLLGKSLSVLEFH